MIAQDFDIPTKILIQNLVSSICAVKIFRQLAIKKMSIDGEFLDGFDCIEY